MDLSLIPLKDLADEICRRAKSAIIHVHMDDTDTKLNGYWNWVGDYYIALGMCEQMKEYIKNNENE